MHYWIAGLGFALSAATPQEEPKLPDWMSGCWEQRSGDRWTEECWMPPRGGIMLGNSRSGTGERVSEWETMQIVLNQENGDGPVVRMAFLAAPRGGDRTMFAWSPGDLPGVAFFNAAHDYPQRIRYWREGERLMAETSLADGSKPRRWTYQRMTVQSAFSASTVRPRSLTSANPPSMRIVSGVVAPLL
ncbi:MAG: DUF6265 family protein [Sphingomonas sp.]|uniref:DUF6265 family protein n=1 Tax=Sphingomonas sp. TaxID=28214 RepID=UPI00227309A4|nr:DUF6265 family protein [Sphingomonas sp.]MCX8475079.1 DUF6265 family protein [Sphingomonas sp.]